MIYAIVRGLVAALGFGLRLGFGGVLEMKNISLPLANGLLSCFPYVHHLQYQFDDTKFFSTKEASPPMKIECNE